jgi:hypothetical protein
LGEQYRSLSSSLWIFLHSLFFLVPLRPKYSPQYPILKQPKPMFLSQCERPRFTPIKSNTKIELHPIIPGHLLVGKFPDRSQNAICVASCSYHIFEPYRSTNSQRAYSGLRHY